MNAHAAIKNTFLEDFFVQKCLTINLIFQKIIIWSFRLRYVGVAAALGYEMTGFGFIYLKKKK